MNWAALAALAAFLIVSGAIIHARRAPIRSSLVRFVTSPGGPFNLAVARICFFAAVAYTLPGRDAVQPLIHLPRQLIFAPTGLGHALAALPLDPGWVGMTHDALVGGCVLGVLGILPRLSAATVVVAGFYYLGIPQLYGSVVHYHHLLWVGAILAFSPSADALSVPAAWRALRRPDGTIAPRQPSLAYALPLRLIWLIMGVLYLSAGLAKYRFDGLAWLEPMTLRGWLHLLWFQGSFRPPFGFRPDEYPVLLVFGASFTLLFETTFWFWVLFDRTRPYVAAAGLLFHNSIGLLMRIPFFNLQLLYPTLIDWDGLSERLWGRRPLIDAAAGEPASARMRVLAALLPAGAVRLLPPAGSAPRQAPARPRRVSRPLLGTGALLLTLLLANASWGLTSYAHGRRAANGWPIAAYPSFAGTRSDSDTVLELQGQDRTRTWRQLSLQRELGFLADSRLTGLFVSILRESAPQRRVSLGALLSYIRSRDPALSRYHRFRVIAEAIDVNPRQLGRRLSTRVVLQS